MLLNQMSQADLQALENSLTDTFNRIKSQKLQLDLTRGKPSSKQLDLSNRLDGILEHNYHVDGMDLRNYGGIDGLASAKTLFANLIDVESSNILIGGNSSLTLMYQALQFAMFLSNSNDQPSWQSQGTIKFLCPVPGYDRHFRICETFGIEMINIPMDNNGPDMDAVEELVKSDHSIKGIWCVPRFSNPTGTVYSNDVVERLAKLGKIAASDFRIMWDNAYAAHIVDDDAAELANIYTLSQKYDTENNVLIFGSTSKITFAGSGLAFMAASPANLTWFKQHLGVSSIGPDKVNQQRHLALFPTIDALHAHMKQHAALLKPKFAAVLDALKDDLGANNSDNPYGQWTEPKGGYFISFDTQPQLASTVVNMAGELGVKLTPAGATFPYGKDPNNSNIRIAPSFASLDDVKAAMDVFVLCVKLATVQQALAA